MTEERCEPPPELRGVDGWHWVRLPFVSAPAPIAWMCNPDNQEREWRMPSSPAFVSGESKTAQTWRYVAPVAAPEEVAALRAEVMRAGAECADMGGEIVRLRAEIASLRVTLGQHPPTEGAEPVGCPLPGMCVMVHDNAILRARVAQLEAALRKIANSGIETFAINVIGGDDISVEGSNRFAHERDVAAIMATARAALEEKP